ncbi:hypothetical protein I7I48_00071 [Histoplasma ohiense]|nr:hypothetical protein I7I48_00071 [Histoplasma ohiense (nom. inval.)]
MPPVQSSVSQKQILGSSISTFPEPASAALQPLITTRITFFVCGGKFVEIKPMYCTSMRELHTLYGVEHALSCLCELTLRNWTLGQSLGSASRRRFIQLEQTVVRLSWMTIPKGVKRTNGTTISLRTR